MISPIKCSCLSFKGNDMSLNAREGYDKKTHDNDNIAKDAAEQSGSIPPKSPQIPVEGCGKKLDIKEA